MQRNYQFVMPRSTMAEGRKAGHRHAPTPPRDGCNDHRRAHEAIGLGPFRLDLTGLRRQNAVLAPAVLPEYACLSQAGDLARTTDITSPEPDTAMVADATGFHTTLRDAEARRPEKPGRHPRHRGNQPSSRTDRPARGCSAVRAAWRRRHRPRPRQTSAPGMPSTSRSQAKPDARGAHNPPPVQRGHDRIDRRPRPRACIIDGTGPATTSSSGKPGCSASLIHHRRAAGVDQRTQQSNLGHWPVLREAWTASLSRMRA